MGLNIKISKSQRPEGKSFKTTFSNIDDQYEGKKLFWGIIPEDDSNVDKTDFLQGKFQNAFVVDDSFKYTMTHTIKKDEKTEGDEKFKIKLYSDKRRENQLSESNVFTILDTSKEDIGTYSILTSSNKINEGDTLWTTFQTKNVAEGKQIYWKIDDEFKGGLKSSDFSKGAFKGKGKVGADGNFVLKHIINEDEKTEGDETMRIQLFSDKQRKNKLGESAFVTINDTSLEAEATYTISTLEVTNTRTGRTKLKPDLLFEGKTFKTIISTTNVPNGRRLYWSFSGENIEETDFSDGPKGMLSGSKKVGVDGKFEFEHTITEDGIVEGEENLKIQLFEDKKRTTQLGDDFIVSIADDEEVKIEPSYYTISDTQTFEGETFSFKVFRSGNFGSSHTLDIKVQNGTAFNNFDFSNIPSTISFASGDTFKWLEIDTIDDTTYEPDESFEIILSSSHDTAKFRTVSDSRATLTILNDNDPLKIIDSIGDNSSSIDIEYLLYNAYLIDKSKNYLVRRSVGDYSLDGDLSNKASVDLLTEISVDYSYSGGESSDRLLGSKGADGKTWAHDFFEAGFGDDFIGAGGGRDVIHAGSGDDEIRGGFGHDIVDGGEGADVLYGGGGRNTFNNNDDGWRDEIYVLSDYHSHNEEWGRKHNGANADTIASLGSEDRVTILGAATEELSIISLSDGLGIFANGSLEAVVTDDDWNISTLANNVFGDASRFW